ncbi:HU family DNA-binding protein [Adonisia turfae]|uniref:HU family DNA-binding protein n=1 Tax=Adonisia turfae CCMR0081 TaxID=2292702 RepID=A0A6M0RY14_9CYAN|nr:HU family DNA-binding protein [Adonisia turfae]NEZ61036.1 HU family DNA-binding protein [Adonisia turfae CCMR0081]
MNRSDLISRIAEQADLTKKQASEALDATISTIMDAVKTDGDVQLIGFGTFTAVHSEAREGRNPRTGETLQIPERKTPKFKAGKAFKDLLNAA